MKSIRRVALRCRCISFGIDRIETMCSVPCTLNLAMGSQSGRRMSHCIYIYIYYVSHTHHTVLPFFPVVWPLLLIYLDFIFVIINLSRFPHSLSIYVLPFSSFFLHCSFRKGNTFVGKGTINLPVLFSIFLFYLI